MQLNKRFFMCTNNNTSNIEIIALFCDFTFNSWITSVDQCILQDFSSLPYDCKFAEFFSVSSRKKKTRIDSMLASSVVRMKTAGTPSAYDCVTNVELTCSVIHYWTDWRQNEIYSFYAKKERKATNLPSTTWLFKARRYPSYKRYVSSLRLFFFI